jgi:integrase
MHYWLRYLEQVACLDRGHPFAFVNLYREPRGAMYTIDKFAKAHGAAVERIGLSVYKGCGTTPHGHRHAYGRRLKSGGLDPLLIQRCMHHASEESHLVYTEPSMREALAALDVAGQRLLQASSPFRPTTQIGGMA